MTKMYSEKKDSAGMAPVSKSDRRLINSKFNLLNLPVKKNLRFEILRSVYLILILTGLAGTLYIIYNVITSISVDSIHMILVFLLSCIPLTIMAAGIYGFSMTSGKAEEY